MKQLNEQAQRVIELATEQARDMNHAYVGTEHLLLGVMLEGSCHRAGILGDLGLSFDVVRSEIEKLIQRDPSPVSSNPIPLTPRARRAIQLATEIATGVSVDRVSPEHLLVGLIGEGEGVAALALRKLGLDLPRVTKAALRIQVRQMQMIERIVRPLRASIKRKRRIREELLAHLTAIFDEELTLHRDPIAALDAASHRFGNPTELSRDLARSLPAPERFAWHIERWLGWRAPESATTMVLRSAFIGFLIVLSIFVFGILVTLVRTGLGHELRHAICQTLPLALLVPAVQFSLGCCYYKIRDAWWGVFGSRRSRVRVAWFSILAGASVALAGIGLSPLIVLTPMGKFNAIQLYGIVGVVTSAVLPFLARLRGSVEIRDTIWATLDLNSAG